MGISAGDSTLLGLHELQLETSKSRDMAAVLKAFPAGQYVFAAQGTNGANYVSEASLSHSLPVAPRITVRMAKDALKVSWKPDKAAEELHPSSADIFAGSTSWMRYFSPRSI